MIGEVTVKGAIPNIFIFYACPCEDNAGVSVECRAEVQAHGGVGVRSVADKV